MLSILLSGNLVESGNWPIISADILDYLLNKLILSLIHISPLIIAYIICELFH